MGKVKEMAMWKEEMRQDMLDEMYDGTGNPQEAVTIGTKDVQVGGSHYKSLAIQPIEYIVSNNIPYREGNIIKYVTRYNDKNGVEDLKKARHYLDMLIEEHTNGK